MMDRNTSPLTESELHRLVDQQVHGAERAALEARLSQDPAALATVAQWRQQRDLLRGLHQDVLDEPIPPTLMAAARQTVDSRHALQQGWRWGGVAAAVVLSFGTGWLTHNEWQAQRGGALAKTTLTADFVRQASYAHAVYAPEVRHPVEVAAAEQEHLVQWLSKRVGKPIKVPNLSSQGYELVGGRLLPGDAGARAQFMFQNATGVRVTLYLGAISAKAEATTGARTGDMDGQETAFRFATEGALPSFYWVDQGFGYALTGPLKRDALMQLAQTVYQQL